MYSKMKRNDFNEIKGLDIKTLLERVKVWREELSELTLDKNMNKLKDLTVLKKRRKDIAQILTVIRQKELLLELEGAEGKGKEEEKGQKI